MSILLFIQKVEWTFMDMLYVVPLYGGKLVFNQVNNIVLATLNLELRKEKSIQKYQKALVIMQSNLENVD